MKNKMIDVNRPDVYRAIHKALRKAMFEFSYATGRVNFSDKNDLLQLKKQFDELMLLLETHGEKEDKFCLPMLEKKRPGCTRENEEEHTRIHRELDLLIKQMNSLLLAEEDGLHSAIWEFYYSFNEFVSGYLMHMQMEEIQVTRLVYELLSDDEINAITAAIIKSIPPAEMPLVAKHMIPALYPADRFHMMKNIMDTAPEPAFNAMMQLCKNLLSEKEFNLLEDALSLVNVNTTLN